MSEPKTTSSGTSPGDGSQEVAPPPTRMNRQGIPPRGTGSGAASTVEMPETELWQGRTRVAHFAGRWVVWCVVSVVAMTVIVQIANRTEWLDWKAAILAILATLVVSAAAILGKVAVQILGIRYRITSQRVFVHRGLLSQTIDQTELIRVDDVRIHKTLVDRMFGLGTVAIVSSDFSDGELRVDGVSKPEQVAEAIRTCARALRQRAMYVESI